MFSSNILSQILNFISGIIVIKMVSTQDFGNYSVAVNYVNIYVVILSGFLTSTSRRFIAYYRGSNENEKISGIIRVSLIYGLILSVVLMSYFLFFSDIISKSFLNSSSYSKFLFFYSFSIPFMIFSSYFSSYLLGFEKYTEFSNSNNIFPNVFRLIFLLFWWIFLPFKEIGITLSLVFKSFINFIFSLFYLKNEFKFLKYNPKYEFKNWFKFSFPSFLRYVFSYLADNIGIIVLGSLKDNLSAGIYRGSNFIISILWNLNIAFSSTLFPRITKLIAQNYDILALKTLRKFFILNTLIVYFIVVFLIFFGKFVLSLLGKDYVLGYNVLIILSFQVLIGAFFSPFEIYLEAKGRTDLNLINYIVYSFSTILFLFIFTKIYSKEGTALAYLFSIIILSISRLLMFKIVSKNRIYNFYDYFVFFLALALLVIIFLIVSFAF